MQTFSCQEMQLIYSQVPKVIIQNIISLDFNAFLCLQESIVNSNL